MLSQIPGLGKKTAQKIVLHLRGKLAGDDELDGGGGEEKEVVDSLTAMGFDTASARKAVRSILEDPEIRDLARDPQAREFSTGNPASSYSTLEFVGAVRWTRKNCCIRKPTMARMKPTKEFAHGF